MKKLVRSFLLLGIVVGAMVLSHLITQAAVTINNATCEMSAKCDHCLYRSDSDSALCPTSGNICRSLLCDAHMLDINVCKFKAGAANTCTARRGEQGFCSGCSFSNCGCVTATNTCTGCACPAFGGSGMHTGWDQC